MNLKNNKQILAVVVVILLTVHFNVHIGDSKPIHDKTYKQLISSNTEFSKNKKVLIVDDEGDGDYTTIQDAIKNAEYGDVIEVYSGVYQENVIVNIMRLTIKGIAKELGSGNDIGKPIIDGSGKKDVLTITADAVTISNFQLINGNFGINATYSNYNTFSNNTINNNNFGIFSFFSTMDRFTNNIICNCSVAAVFAISVETIISGNTFSGNNLNSIHLDFSRYNKIENNIFNNKGGITFFGDIFLSSWNTHIIQNNSIDGRPIYYYKNQKDLTVPKDGAQVILANCTNFTIQNLNISDVDGGISLGFSPNNKILGNNIKNTNFYGLGLLNSDNNVISRNNFSFNKNYSIYTLFYSDNNVFYLNRFENNEINAWDTCDNKWDDGGIGNYWDDYYGWDNDNDGIGDIPYLIRPFGPQFNMDRHPIMCEQKPDLILPEIEIDFPKARHLHLFNHWLWPILSGKTRIIGPILGIDIKVNAWDYNSGIHRVEIYIDDELKKTDYYESEQVQCVWQWDETVFGEHGVRVTAYDLAGNNNTTELTVNIFNYRLPGPPG